jgi:hypothetical protein
LTRHIDICRLLVNLIDDFYIDARASRNADEIIVNTFGCKELLEDANIFLTEIARYSGVVPVVCQE